MYNGTVILHGAFFKLDGAYFLMLLEFHEKKEKLSTQYKETVTFCTNYKIDFFDQNTY